MRTGSRTESSQWLWGGPRGQKQGRGACLLARPLAQGSSGLSVRCGNVPEMLWSQQHPCRRAGRWSVWLRGARSPPEPPGGGGGGEGAVVTLHSGQSCRGTPGPRGSTAGTGPTGQGAGQHGQIPPTHGQGHMHCSQWFMDLAFAGQEQGLDPDICSGFPPPPQSAPRSCTPVRTATCDPSWEPGIPPAPRAQLLTGKWVRLTPPLCFGQCQWHVSGRSQPQPGQWPAYLRLHHGWALCAQGLHGLEHVNHAFIAHPLQDDAQCDEHPGAAHASTAQGEHRVRAPTPRSPTRPALRGAGPTCSAP